MSASPRSTLSAYITSSQTLIAHIYTLFDAYKRTYSSLAMETPEKYLSIVTPTVANYDGLTGLVLLTDGTRVTLWELENPEQAAAGLRDLLAEDIEKQADALIRLRAANSD